MGDASAASGFIRRMGLRKVRHLTTSWMWVQEEEASRELQYHTVKGSDNIADLFTMPLAHNSIKRHTEALGCEVMFGRDPIAFTVNSLSAKVSIEKLAVEMENQLKTKRRTDAWTRIYKTANRRGPPW